MKSLQTGLTLLLLASLLSGCGLFYSKKGQLKTRIGSFEAALNAGKYAAAAKMMQSDVRYETLDKKKYAAGATSAKAFLNPLKEAKFTTLFLHQKELRKVDESTYLAVVEVQLRRGDATGSENIFQTFGMIWEYHEESRKWFLTEIKETTKPATSRS